VIITTDATGLAGDVHDRTRSTSRATASTPGSPPPAMKPDRIYEILDGMVVEPLAVRPVSTRVDRVGNDGRSHRATERGPRRTP
jgi:hypothetical protein